MSTELELHHVGEAVLKSLFEGLDAAEKLSVSCRVHQDCTMDEVLRAAGVSTPWSFKINVPLAAIPFAGTETGFDGAHRVDVLCHDQVGHGVAVEAKLGLDRMSPAEFERRFLTPVEVSTHRDPRFKGSMTGILNFRAVDGEALELHTVDPPALLAAPWILVLRERVWSGKWGEQAPHLNNGHVVVFEDLVKAHGGASSFDELVLRVVGHGFADAWGLQL